MPGAGKIPPRDSIGSELVVERVKQGWDILVRIRSIRQLDDIGDPREAAIAVALLRICAELESLGFDVAGMVADRPPTMEDEP